MGLVYENITLKNAIDVGACNRGIIGDSQIRQVNVSALVDTGAEMLVINEEVRQELGLEVRGKKGIRLANEAPQICQFTEAVEIHWKDRHFVTQALVLDGLNEVLLGAIPLEGLNVIVDPGNMQLVGAYGDEVVYKIK
jgi:clan AA aspartic protease